MCSVKLKVVIGEVGVIGQQVAREPPELVVKPIEHIVALDAHLLHHFLIEVVEQFLAGIPLAGRDLALQFTL